MPEEQIEPDKETIAAEKILQLPVNAIYPLLKDLDLEKFRSKLFERNRKLLGDALTRHQSGERLSGAELSALTACEFVEPEPPHELNVVNFEPPRSGHADTEE